VARLDRRSFLAWTSGSLVSLATVPLLRQPLAFQNPNSSSPPQTNSCWLDVCAAFIVEDPALGIHSEIVLTSDTFVGTRGFEDGADSTDYEIYLYDAAGTPVGPDSVAKRLTVPAMQTTVIKTADLVGTGKTFWGGLKVRLRPHGREPMHASDLFSSAFVRWQTANSFDNVHANPDPLEWQKAESFFYSMPFPPLAEYEGLFSLFNPYVKQSKGIITLYDQLGSCVDQVPYDLKPHSSLLLDLRQGAVVNEVGPAFRSGLQPKRRTTTTAKDKGGTIAITNDQGSVKNFGYLMIRREGREMFSVEHPIHQPPYHPVPTKPPFDTEGKFLAKNVLYTPLVFHGKRVGGLVLNSRFHLSSGAPMEDSLWLDPFITDRGGNVAWQVSPGTKLPANISARQVDHGVLRLGGYQSCILDSSSLGLPEDFAGGLSLAVAPNTNHTLMKVELTVSPWDARGFTHFRPGLRSARAYQQAKARGGLSTDYIVTNARVERTGHKILRDELVGVLNIDDKNLTGDPTLEIFCSEGLLERIEIGKVAPFGCRHFLLSEILSEKSEGKDLSLRLTDGNATLLMSVLHLDYVRQDVALDHGSDRFSTFSEFGCGTVS